MGQSAVAGVGGTRMCDWWFTEDAVLIDTAGRYTTQDSDARVDKAGWDAFLSLLKRTRARQPLNGVIVAIALSDIAAAPQAERLAHARAIRRRVKELSDHLGVRVPVYALFTKADLITGFMEFYDDLDRERRGQVWGMTFPLSKTGEGTAGLFTAEFGLLVERLNQRLLDRLQAERSPDRRTLIAGFPAQVASLQTPLAEFLGEAFGGSRLDPAPFLRGVYLSSGTQEGTPIDRLTGTMARSFGIDQQRAPSLRPEQGRSYFLGRLLKDVIFGEATLVARDPAAVKRNRLIYAATAAVAALVALLGAGALIQTRAANDQAMAQSQHRAGRLRPRRRKALPLDPVADDDLARIDPVLDQARALPFGYDAGSAPAAVVPRPGPDRQAGRGRPAGLSQRPAQHPAAPAGVPAGAPDAAELQQARLPLRSHPHLPDAGRRRSAGPGFGEGVDAPGLGERLSRRRQQAAARPAWRRHLAALLDTPLPQGAAERRPGAGCAPHLQPRVAGRTGLCLDPPLGAGDAAAGVAPVRRRGRHRRRRVLPPLRQADDRRHPGLLHREGFYKVLLPELPAADEAGRTRQLGAGQGVGDRARPARRCRTCSRTSSSSTRRTTSRPGAGC